MRQMSPLVGRLYANGVLFAVIGILLALIGAAVGFAADFWWLLWVGLAMSGVGAFLWNVASTAVARIFGGLFVGPGLIVALIGLIRGLTADSWLLLWIGLGVALAGFAAAFCGSYLAERTGMGLPQ